MSTNSYSVQVEADGTVEAVAVKAARYEAGAQFVTFRDAEDEPVASFGAGRVVCVLRGTPDAQ